MWNKYSNTYEKIIFGKYSQNSNAFKTLKPTKLFLKKI